MTRLVNDPQDFPRQALGGFVDAFPRYVRAVHGGVVRATKTPRGKVALVVGGGSGHYPAFAGWVGQGFADGAVCGNVFTSPSSTAAYSVCRAVERGSGVLIGFGNYAGDVLHFGQAAQRLRAEGIDARCIAVTDDIASAGTDFPEQRRGIAGDFPVFRITAAACEEGMSIDQVESVFRRANARTRSIGVAFAGCTLPGAGAPLFTVPWGSMGVGMGIHGEPGIDDAPMVDSATLAADLVDRILADRPGGAGRRVLPILNGLGDTKYEEMFVLWGDVCSQLAAAGLDIVDPQVGEFVTSLDMAGVSLTLVWLDAELERLWLQPCDTPAFRRGCVAAVEADRDELSTEPPLAPPVEEGGPPSREAAASLLAVLDGIHEELSSQREMLGDLDAVAGDGDHGIGMEKGARAAHAAAREAVELGAGLATTLRRAATAWSDEAGGTSGALWGAFLLSVAESMNDADAPSASDLVRGLRSGVNSVEELGGARPGDKSMVDAMEPFVSALENVGQKDWASFATGWLQAVETARQATERTKNHVARVGRSRPLGDKSLGTPDPGATSFVLVMDAVGRRMG